VKSKKQEKPKRPSYEDRELRDPSIIEMQKTPASYRGILELIKRAIDRR
jgi:hypothetical protein